MPDDLPLKDNTPSVSKEELNNLVLARKLLRDKVSVAWYWAIFMSGIVAPAIFAPIILAASAPISVAVALYLFIVPARNLKKKLAALNVKIHETRTLSVEDFCCPTQAELPLYQVIETQPEQNLVSLKILLSSKPEEIGNLVHNQNEQFVIPYLFKD